MENQLPEKGLRLAAADRSGLRRGRLSDFFYNVDRFRKALGIRFNIEMLWLPDEMFSQKGKHFRIAVGDPIPVAELQHCGSLREQTEEVRKKTYFLENKLAGGAKTR